MRKRTLSVLSFAVLLTVPVAILTPKFVGTLSYAVEAGQARAARAELGTAKELSRAFQTVARALRPSVVNVSTVRRIRVGNQRSPFEGHPELRQFREFFGEALPESAPFRESSGLGTGVIVSEDGYILTNHHVVAGAEQVRVTLTDGRVLPAKIVGRDDKTDIAVLKVEGSGFLPAPLGDSENVEVGEWVLAIGNPFGFRETVTSGIVSAKHRDNVGITQYENFIQTDAAVNPGNSGGPLVNLDGEVVGINTAIATRTGNYAGVSFAIPINMGRGVMEQLIADGKVVRGWLGVVIQDLSDELAQSFGFRGTEGVLIPQILPDGPGGKAGIRDGDILVSFDGEKLRSSSHLRNVVARTKPGAEVDVEVFRAGETKTLAVTLGVREGDPKSPVPSTPETSEDELGLTVRDLTEEASRRAGVGSGEGVLVSGIKTGGLAAKAGLRAGDVILHVDGHAASSVDELRRLVDERDLGEGLRLRIAREGLRRYVFLKTTP